ncbi:MAG: superinfection immunity protein [Candidatus Methylomirabilales bacterium]
MTLYFIPSIVGTVRDKRNIGAIFVLNIFLGWTLIGWVVALVWAVAKD